ncbi:MAG: D-alanyl-D-alanine carboxypeptidase [Firmicutes bacterium]|nr:D-alanyl-D-alanine carboxypeptidase [Bacillota bacterium]
MKKSICILLTICIVFASCASCFGAELAGSLWTDTYLVMDMTTGDVLAESNMNGIKYPASLTKMMTAVVAYEYYMEQPYGLQTLVYADEEAAETEPTKFGLRVGEAMSVDEALNIMLLISANDIAVMLAKEVGGTTEYFARLMNQKAAELGMENTHFVTPNGLHDDDHYSTAADLAKLAMYLLGNEYLAGIVAKSTYDYEATNRHEAGTVYSTNLLYNDQVNVYVGYTLTQTIYTRGRVIGVKTGTTPEAGGCLAAAVENGLTKVLIIILDSRDGYWSYQIERYADAHILFDWAFDHYVTENVFKSGDSYGIMKVKRGEFNKVETVLSENVPITHPVNTPEGYITSEYVLDESITAPFEAGTPVGTLTVYRDGDVFGTYDIVTANAVVKGGILSIFGIEDAVAHKIFKTAGTVLLVIFILFLMLMAIRTYNKRKAKKRKAEKARRKAELEARRRAEWGDRYDEMLAKEKAEREKPEIVYYYEKNEK